jgi:hypothetical protein
MVAKRAVLMVAKPKTLRFAKRTVLRNEKSGFSAAPRKENSIGKGAQYQPNIPRYRAMSTGFFSFLTCNIENHSRFENGCKRFSFLTLRELFGA